MQIYARLRVINLFPELRLFGRPCEPFDEISLHRPRTGPSVGAHTRSVAAPVSGARRAAAAPARGQGRASAGARLRVSGRGAGHRRRPATPGQHNNATQPTATSRGGADRTNGCDQRGGAFCSKRQPALAAAAAGWLGSACCAPSPRRFGSGSRQSIELTSRQI